MVSRFARIIGLSNDPSPGANIEIEAKSCVLLPRSLPSFLTPHTAAVDSSPSPTRPKEWT